MGQLNRDSAEVLRKKLDGVPSSKGTKHHDYYDIYHGQKYVTSIGVCRSPRRDKPHGHLKTNLMAEQAYVKLMQACKIQKDEWLRHIGVIVDPPQTTPQNPPQQL
jgi:hypothetical protein